METATIDYQALAKAMLGQLGTREKALPSATPTTIYGHGNGGLFSTAGLSRPVFSALAVPQEGLAARGTNETNPLHLLITGIDGSTGSEPNGPCDDPPVAGVMRACAQTWVFGRFSRQSRVFDVTRIGEVRNRGEFLDLQFQGSAQADSIFKPTMPGDVSLQNALRSEVAKGIWELGVAFVRDFSRKLYTGNPANNTGGGGYQEFRGLDMLINTGYVDAVDGTTTCPAVDSLVLAFGANITANAGRTVSDIVAVYHQLLRRASMMGLSPVRWAIVMRSTLFYELTAIWPCAYNTSACSNAQVGADAQIRMRDEMRQGSYLLIDGMQVEVIQDESITETNAAGTFTSDIYFVPLTILGGVNALYLEYFDFSTPGGAVEAANTFGPAANFAFSDGGRFIWHRKPPNNWCVQLMALLRPRLILETPHLAARITGVSYTPMLTDRSAWPNEPGYVAGGVTNR